uniref:Uncharacterized protein n=1 Tax=Arundo donax TaxID=35708 RepID=A0A0A9CM81_ARUDO
MLISTVLQCRLRVQGKKSELIATNTCQLCKDQSHANRHIDHANLNLITLN